MSILDTSSGRIEPNWKVDRTVSGLFRIRAPYKDGLPGETTLGNFFYRPHAELAVRAPAMAEAMENFCDRVECGEVRSKRTYTAFCEILDREPRP